MIRKILQSFISPPMPIVKARPKANNYDDVVGYGVTVQEDNRLAEPTPLIQDDYVYDVQEDLTLHDIQDEVELSLLGKSVQQSLDKWGFIGKQQLNAKIVFEDSKSVGGESHFFFEYDSKIQPSDFYNFALKKDSKMSKNIEASLISDGVHIFQAGTGAKLMAKIIVLNGRV